MSKIQIELETTVVFNTPEEFVETARKAYVGESQYVFALGCEPGTDDYKAVIICREVFDSLMYYASRGGMVADVEPQT